MQLDFISHPARLFQMAQVFGLMPVAGAMFPSDPELQLNSFPARHILGVCLTHANAALNSPSFSLQPIYPGSLHLREADEEKHQPMLISAIVTQLPFGQLPLTWKRVLESSVSVVAARNAGSELGL